MNGESAHAGPTHSAGASHETEGPVDASINARA
jgi:hypothetical protein